MDFKPIQKLNVTRTLSTGESAHVGVLAQNHQGVFFQYDSDYLNQFANLSPFLMEETTVLQSAPSEPHMGLHGLFADSLPDGWGLLLQDRVFRQHNILPSQITAMDRLAFIGSGGMGALSFDPVYEYKKTTTETFDLEMLGLEAQAIFDGQTQEVLGALVAAGSSGGARPKAQLFFSSDSSDQCRTKQCRTKQCRTEPQEGDEAWLVKFTSQNLQLGHEEGLCEAVYLQLAEMADLQPPEWQLLKAPDKSGADYWLALKRFDWTNNTSTNKPGRLHMHSACGLLDADFRTPSLDYVDLIKASRQLCKSPAVGQLQFCRAIFNLFACNQDDHSKNWAFLQEDNGQWQVAPFYDVTFSPHPFNQHATAYDGFGRQPPLKTIQKLATHAGFSNWKQAKQQIQKIVEVISNFTNIAEEYGIHKKTITLMRQELDKRRQENAELF